MDGTWTIGELAERAAAALAADGAVQLSGRVRDLPNTRLIRWYTTIGLLDPPLGRRGRIALYGPRHLLQLVAVKRRQAEGRSIAEIQIELAAATKDTLARIAALPPGVDGTDPTTDSPPRPDHPLQDRNAPQATPSTGRIRTPAAHSAREALATPTHDPESANAAQTPTTSPTPPGTDAAASQLPGLTAESPETSATSPGREGPATRARNPEGANGVESSGSPLRERSSTPTDGPGVAMETADSVGTPAGPEGEGGGERRDFWRARPDVSYGTATVAADYGRPLPPVVQGVRLAPGLTLLLDGPALSGDDLAAIDAAARPLLDELHRRGLLNPAESPARPPADHFRRSP